MKSILVTGGAGFIGSNFVPYFAEKYADYHVINLDKLTYAGNLDNVSECNTMQNYTFVQGDICDRALIEKLFAEHAAGRRRIGGRPGPANRANQRNGSASQRITKTRACQS